MSESFRHYLPDKKFENLKKSIQISDSVAFENPESAIELNLELIFHNITGE
jgi:hypothetical protein